MPGWGGEREKREKKGHIGRPTMNRNGINGREAILNGLTCGGKMRDTRGLLFLIFVFQNHLLLKTK